MINLFAISLCLWGPATPGPAPISELGEIMKTWKNYRQQLGNYEAVVHVDTDSMEGIFLIRDGLDGSYLVETQTCKEKAGKRVFQEDVAFANGIKEVAHLDQNRGTRRPATPYDNKHNHMKRNIFCLVDGNGTFATDPYIGEGDIWQQGWKVEKDKRLLKMTQFVTTPLRTKEGGVRLLLNTQPVMDPATGSPVLDTETGKQRFVPVVSRVFWCDPDKNHTVVACEIWEKNRIIIRTDVTKLVKHGDVWVPAEGRKSVFFHDNYTEVANYKLISISLRANFTPDAFRVKWKDGFKVATYKTPASVKGSVPEIEVIKGEK